MWIGPVCDQYRNRDGHIYMVTDMIVQQRYISHLQCLGSLHPDHDSSMVGMLCHMETSECVSHNAEFSRKSLYSAVV